MNKVVKNILLWSFILIYLIVAFGFASRKYEETICNTVSIEILDSTEYRFLSDADIKEMMDLRGYRALGEELHELNTHKLEEIVSRNSAVATIEAFKNIQGELNIHVTQRKPIARIEDKKGIIYYIDGNGFIMPEYKKYSAHVLYVNGEIPNLFEKGFSGKIDKIKTGKEKLKVLQDIYTMSRHINENKLWRSQFLQMYIHKDHEIELIPRVGAHIIHFGDISDYKYKFFKLKAIYEKGFNALGWNKYEHINLKFSNQVICTKR